MTLSLYDIGEEMGALDALLFDAEGEVGPELQAWLEEFSLLERTKVDRYGAMMKNLEAEATACKEESARLIARAMTKANALARMKRMALEYMTKRGATKLEGEKFTLSKTKNSSPSVTWLDIAGQPTDKPNVDALPLKLTRLIPEPDNAAARLAVIGQLEGITAEEAGKFVKVAVGHHLRIR